MFDNVLIVCIGNICRSPMAEALLRHKLSSSNQYKNINIASAGLGALVGYDADITAQNLMKAMNIDISQHKARQLEANLISEYDLILTMEKDHIDAIHANDPLSKGKIHLLGKWSDFEIPDPYKQSEHEFKVALELIERGIDEWIEKLWQ